MMKRTFRRLTAVLLTLCMALSLLPVSAFAEGETQTDTVVTQPEQITGITLTAEAAQWPEGGEKPADLTITAANQYALKNNRIHLELQGAPGTNYYYSTDESNLQSNVASTDSTGWSGFYYYPSNAEAGSLSVKLWFSGDTDHDGTLDAVFGPVTVNTYMAEELPPLAMEDMENETVVLSTRESDFNLNLKLPKGTIPENADLELRLYGHEDGLLYGRTEASTGNKPGFYSNSMQDARYDRIFQDYYQQAEYTAVYGTLYLGRVLKDSQRYDVKVISGGEVLVALENLVEVSGLPVTTLSDYSQLGVNQTGKSTAYIQLTVANGNIDDYKVSVYDGENVLLGTSKTYRVSYANTRETSADFVVSLNKPLQEGSSYVARLETGTAFTGDREVAFSTNSGKRSVQMVFASSYYANIVLQTVGFDPERTYRAELNQSGRLLATLMTQCDENGVFDLEFVDANGEPMRLTPEQSYNVSLKENRNGQWQSATNVGAWFRGAEVFEAGGEGDGTSAAPEEYAYLQIADNGRVGFNARLLDETYGQLDVNKLGLRLHSLANESVTVTLDQRDSWAVTDSQMHGYECYGPIPSGWENVYVFGELLYDGQPLTNANTGKNLLDDGYPDFLTTEMTVGTHIGEVNGLWYTTGLYIRNAKDQDVRVELFRFGNTGVEPDNAFIVSAANDYRFTTLPDLVSERMGPYSMQTRVNGKLMSGNSSYDYFATEAAISSAAGTTYSVSAQSAEHGKVQLIDPTTGEEVTSAKALSEVYVRLVAENGYQPKAGSVQVNGQSVFGRAFRVNGDCTVSAAFEEIPAVRYDITPRNTSSNGTYSVQESAAAGEKVIVSVSPNEGYTVDMDQSYIYYYTPNYTQELLQKDEAGNYYFIMPESGVNLYVRFRSIRTPSMRLYFNNSYGTSSALAQFVTFTKEDGTVVSHNEQVTEGDVIHVQAQLHPEVEDVRQDFEGIELAYNINGQEYRVPVELDENGCGSFVVPNTYGVNIYTTYIPYQQFKVTANSTAVTFDFESGDGAYYPNETVRFRLTFNDGYVQNGKPHYYHPVTGENVELTPDEEGWYSLTMPAKDLMIYCDYRYLSQYRLYISNVSSYCSVYLNGSESAMSSSERVYETTEVTLRIQPNAGYKVTPGSVYVQDSIGNRTDLTPDEDGLYHFTMPSTYVYLYASFESVPMYSVGSRNYNWSPVNGQYAYEAGDTVTVQFTGPEGYVMDVGYPKVTYPYYPYAAMNVEMTPLSDNRYSFIMPAQDCYVEAQFVETPRYSAQPLPSGNSISVSWNETSGRTAFEEGETATFVFSIPEDYVMAPDYPKVVSQQSNQELNVAVTSLGNGTYSFPVPAEDCYLLYEVREGTRYNVGITTSGGNGYVQPSEFNPVAGKTVWVNAWNNAKGGWVNLTCTTSSGAEVALTYDASTRQYSFVMPEENVTLRAEFVQEREVPGGVVTDLDSLLAALGGPECVNFSTWDDDGETNAVAELRGNLKLKDTLDIRSGGVSLSLSGYTLRYNGAADAPAVSVGANVPRFDLVGSVWKESGTPIVGRVVSNGPAVQTADGACAGQYLEIVGGWYTSVQNAALKLGGTTANVTVGGSPVYANTDSADHYAVELTGKLEKGWFGNLLAWSDSGKSIRLPEGDSLTNYLTNQDEKGNTMDPVEVFAIDGAITPVMDVDIFMGMNVPGWTGESLPDSALSASAYEKALFLTQPYTVTFTEDTEAAGELCGTMTLPVRKQANGLWLDFSVEPKFGCSVEYVQYFRTNNESQRYDIWKDKATGLYGFTMPNYDIELDVLVKEIPEAQVLDQDTYLAGQECWNFNLKDVGSFDDNTGFVKVTVLDEQGDLVDRQESHRGCTYMSYFQPGLAPGRYKVYVTVGDQGSQKELGWQWINVIDGVSYNCNMENRWQLTTETRSFDVSAWVEAAATQLPDDLRLEVVDANTQQVLAASTVYSIRVDGGNTADSGTTDKDEGKEKFQNSTSLYFHVELPQPLTDGSTVALRLASDRTTLVCNWAGSYSVSSNFYISSGEMDMGTRVWTAVAECVPAGDFYAYSQNDDDRAVLYPAHIENNIMTVDFSQNWPFNENTSYLWMSVDFGGDFGSRGFGVSVPTQNEPQPYYEMTLDGAYSFHDELATNCYAEYLMSLRDVGEALTVRLNGASGTGTYRLNRYDPYAGNVELASGAIDDLAAFQVPVNGLVTAEQMYRVQVMDADGQYLRECGFYVTALPTVFAENKCSTDDALVLLTLNMDSAQRALLRMGYTSSGEGRVELPVTDNGDGTVTLDLSALPVGIYRLWGRIEGEPQQAIQVGRNMTLEKLPERQQATVQVSDPVTSKYVTTATVTYSGTPVGSVTMSVYEAERYNDYQQSLTFVKDVSIGSGAYTINSKTLGLNGLYALYFTDESGACLGAVMMRMGAPVYTVTFRDGRDGSLLYTVRVAEGQAVQMPAVPAKVGFSFKGWYDGPDDKGDHALADLSSVTEDCTVYAHYDRNVYEVVFADWGGEKLASQDVKYGDWPDKEQMPTPSVREGYVFVDWDLSALEKNGGVTGNVVIYPIFAKAEITVKLELLGGTLPEGQAAEFTVTNGQPAFGNDSMPIPTREGYEFGDWRMDPAGKELYCGQELHQDTVLYANWLKAPRAIAVEAAEGVSVKVPDSAVPGSTVMVTLDVPGYMSVESVVLTYGGSSTLLTVRDGLTSFVMPDEDVTLTVAAVENDGTLTVYFPDYVPETTTVICYDPYSQDVFGREDVSEDGTYAMSGLPSGTYYVTVSDGSFTQTQTVTLSSGEQTVTFTLAQPGTCSGTVIPAADRELPDYLWLYFYDTNGNYVTGTWVNDDGSFKVDSLPMGQYTVEAWGKHAYALADNTVTIGETTGEMSLTLLPTADLSVTLNTASQLGKYAYLMLEKQTDSGWEYVSSGFGSSEDGTTYLFEDAITAAGEKFRVTLTDLTRNYYSGSVRYDSAPVERIVTPEELVSGVCSVEMSYSLPSGTLTDLGGEGNLVAANRTEVNPGDVVDVVIRFNSGETLVSPAFTFGAHSGLTRLDEQTLSAVDAASGSFHATFRVDADAKGVLELPVYAALDGETVRFGTVNLTVNKVTLTAPAQVESKMPFTVYGEAPEGSVVNIRDAQDKVLATVPVSGRFYSGELTLTEGISLTAEVNGLRSESVFVDVASEPVTVDAVWYGDTYYKTEAAFNSRLNAYSFWQYVDMQLEGFDLPIQTRFTNPGNVKSVTYHFCGVDAYAARTDEDGIWSAVFAEGEWGGSGLKALTATVETDGGQTLEMTIAIVNLLIDPSGVVTDENGAPLEGVTVICQVWDETHNAWVNFDAESVGQVNPQITDSEGRYGWFVNEGKYRILASKEGYADYDSLLDTEHPSNSSINIPPSRNDVDFVMHALDSTYHVLQGTVENAQVTLSASEAKSGETVRLTVTADEKFTVKSVSVRTVSGKSVEVGEDGAFIMPCEDVVYSVSAEPASKPALGPAVTAEVVDGKLTVTVENLKLKYAKVVVAFYDESGRMIGVRMNVGAEVAVISGAAKARVFLLNDNLPVMQSQEVSL